MSDLDKGFAEIFQIGGRKKSNSTRKLRASHAKAKAARVAGGSAEVMVKITGYGKGIGHPAAHIKYISRNGKLELENERGEVLEKEGIKELASSWSADFSDAKRHKNQRDTMHLFFSMPPGTDPEGVRQAVREFLRDRFSENHEYVFALHTDQPHPHVHTAIKMVGFNGKRLSVNRDDLQEFREQFASNLRRLGIDAEATPRHVRGVVKMPENLIVKHIEAGDKTHRPRVPKVKAALVKEAVNELIAENSRSPAKEKPWEKRIAEKQKAVREVWKNVATKLLESTQNTLRIKNERPNYERPGSEYIRNQYRVAALYKPSFAQTEARATAREHSSVRNLPPIHVVHKRVVPSLLVHENASINMGGNDVSRDGLRRAGIGLDGASTAPGSRARKAVEPNRLTVDNNALAARISSFVDKMPLPKTLLQETKERLRSDFTKQPAAQVKQVHKREAEKTNIQERQVTPQKNRDLER